MAIDKIHLRRLLQYFSLTPERRLAAVRADARAEIRKRQRKGGSGGDFHSCFWADAKAHAAGSRSLTAATEGRIERNDKRERLYHLLTEGFLDWWNDKRRWINEDIAVIPEPVSAPHNFAEIDGTVKVENILALQVGGAYNRLIYPYFAEKPDLPEEVARMGLWLMSQALPQYEIGDMRILDILRGKPFSIDRYPLVGNEGAIFVERYARMLSDWRGFIREFGG